MKKRFLAILAIAAIVTSFTGCGSSSDGETTKKAEAGTTTSKYYFEANGTKIHLGDLGEDVLSALGDANSTFTAVSCAFEGEDHMYMYDSYQITISTVDGKDVVTAISITNDMIGTPEGVKIGSTDAQVTEAMGVTTQESGNYRFTDGNTTVAIVVKDDEVISINYTYNVQLKLLWVARHTGVITSIHGGVFVETFIGIVIFLIILAVFGVIMGLINRYFTMNVSYGFGKGLSKFNRDMYDEDALKDMDDSKKMNS